MNWKNGDMAVLKTHPDAPALQPRYENAVCQVIGPCYDFRAIGQFLMAGYTGAIVVIKCFNTPSLYAVPEVNLHPIDDPDQKAEPRETEINRPCVA